MATTADISIGSFIKHNGELCVILEYEHRTPGNLRAFYQAKMRNIRTGKLAEYRFRAGESVEVVRVEQKELQYLYAESDSLVCMDNETYEQVYVPKIFFGDSLQFIKEGVTVIIGFDGDNPIFGQAPPTAILQITYTEPGVKGDTATRAMKPATLETGAKINVPLFCNEGELIKVDTRTGEYVERVKQ
ncbi:MAG: elongation factor P [Thermoflexibacter sp.]